MPTQLAGQLLRSAPYFPVADIMLRLVKTPERISPNEKQGGTWDTFFWVRDRDGYILGFGQELPPSK